MGHLPAKLEFYGYDLNVADQGGIHVILKHNGGEEPINAWVSSPTHYLKTVNVSAAPLCGKENRKIIMRYGAKDVSTVNVIRKQCPGAPPASARAPEKVLSRTTDGVGGSLGGHSLNREYGGQCSVGYERSQVQVLKIGGAGSCYAEGEDPRTHVPLGWVDQNDGHSCKVRVHYGAGPFEGVTCDIIIKEIGEEPPASPTPDCGCW